MTVGIICSCLPVTGPIFREYNFGSFPFVKLKSTSSFINTFHRIKEKRQAGKEEVLLETGILGSSAAGQGTFMKTTTTEDDHWNTTTVSSFDQSREVAEKTGDDSLRKNSKTSKISIDRAGDSS